LEQRPATADARGANSKPERHTVTSKQKQKLTTAGPVLVAAIMADLAEQDLAPDGREIELLARASAAADCIELLESSVAAAGLTYFEELIRKFAESNSTQAGDHFTPREVIALTVDILFTTEDDALTKPGTVRTIYDPAAGTGGMLSTAYDHLVEMNPKARPVLYGQDVNPRSYALCKSDI
jgi:type I restriction enzyme M protein